MIAELEPSADPRPVFRRRVLVLPIAAAVIVGLVTFKLSQPPQSALDDQREQKRPAPVFAALDSQNQLVKFERHVGRQEILLVFFDGTAGADRDPILLRIRSGFDRLKRRGIQVLAVSPALPQENRKAVERSGSFPFPLLSDPEFRIHKQWGRLSDDEQQTRTGLFWIDRAGQVAWSTSGPQPLLNLDVLLPLSDVK